MRGRRARTLGGAATAAALILSGCAAHNEVASSPLSTAKGGHVPAAGGLDSPSAQSGGQGGGDAVFFAHGPSLALLVRWTDVSGQLAGSLDDVQVDSAAQSGVTSTDTGFSGLRDGPHVSLTLDDGLGTYTSLTGSVVGATLLLTIPQGDGQLADDTLVSGTVDAFNAAVADLASLGHQQALHAANVQASAAAQAQAQASAAQQAAAQQQLDQQLSAADSTVGSDLSQLAADTEAVPNAKAAYAGGLLQAQQGLAATAHDYGIEQQDAQGCTAANDDGTVGSDDGTVDSDDADVQAAQATVESDDASEESAESTLTDDLQQDRTDLARLQSAQRADPGSAVEVLNSAQNVRIAEQHADGVLAAVEAAEAAADRQAQKYVDQAAAIEKKADELYSRACQ
jgi:hypothetical protein